MPEEIWHEFDPVSWAIIESMLKHIDVSVCEYTYRAWLPDKPNVIYVFIKYDTNTYDRYPIKRYVVNDIDLRKYYRLMYLHHISHHREQSDILKDIHERLYLEGEERGEGRKQRL